jgi:hypothetical protein
MQVLKTATAIALTLAWMTGASVAADAPQGTVIKISATAIDGAGHAKLDFSCTVESQGAVIGTFNSMQGSLTVSHALPDLHMTCNKEGYETVRFSVNGQVTKDFTPSFLVARAS